MTTSQLTVGVHIGWITSLSRRGPAQGPETHHLDPDADSRNEARSRCLPAELPKGTPREPVYALTDLRFHLTRDPRRAKRRIPRNPRRARRASPQTPPTPRAGATASCCCSPCTP